MQGIKDGAVIIAGRNSTFLDFHRVCEQRPFFNLTFQIRFSGGFHSLVGLSSSTMTVNSRSEFSSS